MTRARSLAVGVLAVLLVAALAYLHDPPWIGRVESGLGGWQVDRGTRFRWTFGHASFFVPSDAVAIAVPMRAVYPSRDGSPVAVDISVDDRPLTRVELPNASAWTTTQLPMSGETKRRYRRVDVRVGRTVGPFNLGVQLGEIAVERIVRAQ